MINGKHGGAFYSIHIFRFAKLQPCVARSPRAVPESDVLLAKLARRSLATEYTLTREGLAQGEFKRKFEAVKSPLNCNLFILVIWSAFFAVFERCCSRKLGKDAAEMVFGIESHHSTDGRD